MDLGAFFWKGTRLTGQGQGEGEGVPLTPRRFYHLHWYPLYHKSSTAQMALGAVGFPLTLPPGMVWFIERLKRIGGVPSFGPSSKSVRFV